MTTERDRVPGWYEDPSAPGDAARRRWWDGTGWTLASHWDGTTWVTDAQGGPVADGEEASTGVRRRRVGLWVLIGVLVLGVAGCGALLIAIASWNSADPEVDHQSELSTAESPNITEQLVEVPGYLYQDVSDGEIQAVLDELRQMEQDAGVPKGEGFTSVSLHSVKADDESQNTALGSVGTEVGFLQLYEFADAMPANSSDEPPGAAGELVDEFDVGEVHVFLFEDPSSRESRFSYIWVRHGVAATFDGATRAETQRWVEAYLSQPVRVGSENQALGDAAVPVEGYAYTNTTLRAQDVTMFVTEPIGDVPYSFHVVSDDEGTIGKLLLIEPDPSFDLTTLGAAELASLNASTPGFTSLGTAEHAGVSVEHLEGPLGEAYVWASDGVVAIYTTSERPDAAEPFIDAYLSAR